MLDDKKIAFITCVNKNEIYQEAMLYLQHLQMPEGMQAEYIPVLGASSMAAGYNEGMKRSNAKYKVYLHQDTLIVNPHFAADLLHIFRDERIGLLGVIGCRSLPKTGIWWDGLRVYGRVLHACEAESVTDTQCMQPTEEYMAVESVDGLMLATQYDIPWREDIFTAWHFYDVSQCMEFRRRGYKAAVLGQKSPWCIHKCGQKLLGKNYEQERQKFVQVYDDLLPIAGREA